MKRQKPRIKKEDATMIAIRVAAESGAKVGLAAEVRDVGDGWWTVSVPLRKPGADPVLVQVHQQTGEAEVLPGL